MTAFSTMLRFVVLVAALLGVLRSAAAQPGYFQEVPIPTAPARLYVGPGDYYAGVDVFVRRGQQGVQFDLGSNIAQYLKVRINGGPWTFLYQGGNTLSVTWPASQIEALGGTGSYPVEVNYGGGGTTVAFNLVVVPPAQRAFVSEERNTPRYPDGVLVTIWHTIIVWQGGSAPLDKPLLVVEGIDADNENGPEAYYALGAARGQYDLFPRGQAQGADIAILDFGDGGRPMQANAAVVRRAVEIMRQYSTDRRRSLDVIGVSMGGVVARYALAQMEQDRAIYGIDRFMSVDAPQQGAVIHSGLQSNIRTRQPAEAWPAALNRPAGRQLLQVNAFDTSSPTEHQRFYAEIRALNGGRGYPTLTTNVGVSFGTPVANPNPNARWGRLDVSVCLPIGPPVPDCSDEDFYVAGSTAQAGSYLPLDATALWGRKGLGLVRYELLRYENVANPTFIPYVSALDLTGSTSRFNGPLIALAPTALPSYHDVVPEALVPQMLHRLGYELPAPPSVAFTGPTALAAGQVGRWTASAPDPGAGYQYNWQVRIMFAGCTGGGGGAVSSSFPAGGMPSGGSPVGSPVGGASTSGTGTGGTGDPGGTDLIGCGRWNDVTGSNAILTYSVSSSIRLDLRVQASNALGQSVWSPVSSVCIGGCGGLNLTGGGPPPDVSAKTGGAADVTAPETALLGVSPNPVRLGATGTVRFTIAGAGPVSLRVYDVLGREVLDVLNRPFEAGLHEVTIDTQRLTAGLYVVRLESGSVSDSRRVTITR